MRTLNEGLNNSVIRMLGGPLFNVRVEIFGSNKLNAWKFHGCD